jgi:GAF domain-containing protein
VVAAQSNLPNQFDEEDLRRLMILANQSAAAISHARLFAQAQKRAAQLELVGEIGREISRVQDRRDLFMKVVELTADTFGFHLVSIYGWQEATEMLVMEASNSVEIMSHQLEIDSAVGLIGTAVANKQTVISNDTAKDPRFVTRIDHLEKETCAEMAIPLLVDEKLLGVLDVQSKDIGFFSEIEKMTLEALAAETAIAIDKLQQLARQRQQAWLTTAQLQVAEAIGRSQTVEEMFTAVTRLAPILLGVSFCAVLLWDEEIGVYEGVTLYGGDKEAQEAFSQIKLVIGAWSALDAVHVGQERLTTHRVQDWLRTAVNEIDQPRYSPAGCGAQRKGRP